MRENIQENRSIFNQIRHIQTIGNKLISLPANPPIPDHIGDVVKSPLHDEWYDSIFTNCDKMEKFTTFSAMFQRSLFSPGKKNTTSKIII